MRGLPPSSPLHRGTASCILEAPASAPRTSSRLRGEAEVSFEGRDAYDADENLGRRGGGAAGLEWGSAAGATSPSTVSSVSSLTGSTSSSSTMSPLAMAATAAATIRSQGLVGLSAGSEELLRSPKRFRRKISRVPYKVRA